MNAFARHGIKHLSASSLNLWRGSPGLWALRYLANVKDDGNAAMWRGTAVEGGFHSILRGFDLPAATDLALQNFDANSHGEITDEIDAERNLIPPMLKGLAAFTAAKPFPPLIGTQLKIEHWYDDIPIPVIGYADFVFEDGLIVDLKSTKACPSQPRPDHARQVSLYMAAREAPGALLYCTHAKQGFYRLDEDTKHRALGDLESCARSLLSFLGRVDNAKDALHCLPFDTDHYAFPKLKVPLDQILLAG